LVLLKIRLAVSVRVTALNRELKLKLVKLVMAQVELVAYKELFLAISKLKRLVQLVMAKGKFIVKNVLNVQAQECIVIM